MMGEDVVRQMPTYVYLSDEECRKCIDNEVLLLELEGKGSCLETFGLPTPDVQNRVQRIPKVIAEELFHVETQREISNSECQKLNMDQQDAFCAILKAVHDENHQQ